jgi:hypothetical protein
MSFEFYKNGVKISAPQKVKWYFNERPGIFFESRPEKLEINASFWRRKFDLQNDAPFTMILPEGYSDVTTTGYYTEGNYDRPNTTATDNTSNSASDNGTGEQPSLPETTTDSIDTPRKKRSRKTDELSDLSTKLDNTDSTSAE